jgi:predicted Rossmann fold flavoprotein
VRHVTDVAVVGAGAAGLAAAIFTARAAPALQVVCLDGARRIGAKILVSGGSRCNVTNRIVTEGDYWGGSPRVVRRVLRAFPAERAAAFFASLGVAMHEEDDGKLFPDTNRSRTVLDALLAEAQRLNVRVETDSRVVGLTHAPPCFTIAIAGGRERTARAVVLATGGRSLPKSGSDGFGFSLAQRFGHGYIETTPALAPLMLGDGWHESLSGVSHPARLTLRAGDRVEVQLTGALLWTHFGASGPVALNLSRHWHRARLEGKDVAVTVDLCPDDSFESLEAWLLEQERARPRARVATILATKLPAAVADHWLARARLDGETTMAHLTRDGRRALIHALIATPLDVRDSRGYSYAEVTAGGIPLDEIDPATMESRIRPGVFLVGEMLDVDGRLGGFNFQWAWSSGWVAGQAIARALRAPA